MDLPRVLLQGYTGSGLGCCGMACVSSCAGTQGVGYALPAFRLGLQLNVVSRNCLILSIAVLSAFLLAALGGSAGEQCASCVHHALACLPRPADCVLVTDGVCGSELLCLVGIWHTLRIVCVYFLCVRFQHCLALPGRQHTAECGCVCMSAFVCVLVWWQWPQAEIRSSAVRGCGSARL